MNPEPFGLPAFPLFFSVGVVLATTVFVAVAHQMGHRERSLIAIIPTLAFIALAGAKIYSLLLEGKPWTPESLLTFDGLRMPGALIAVVVSLPFLARILPGNHSLGYWADIGTGPMYVLSSCARISCLLEGCCFGRVCNLPWAIKFPYFAPAWKHQYDAGLVGAHSYYSLYVHPLQLYFLLVTLVVAAWAIWYLPRKKFDWQVLLVAVCVANTGKFAFESIRSEYSMPIQLSAGVIAGLSAIVLAAMHRTKISSAEVRSAS